MVSKFLQNSAFLCLSGATTVLGAKRADISTLFRWCRSFNYSMRDMYLSRVPKGETKTGAQRIRDFIEDEVTRHAGEHTFTEELAKQTLVMGWGGMCWPVDGRGANGKNTIEDHKFKMYVDREALLQDPDLKFDCIAEDMAECDELRNIFHKDTKLTPKGLYLGQNIEQCKQFYKDLGNVRLSVVNKLSNQKPGWAQVHPRMAGADYQVDVGTGKAQAKIRKENKDADKGEWTGRVKFPVKVNGVEIQLAEYLYNMDEEQIELALTAKAGEMYKAFEEAYYKRNLIKSNGAPKVSFGLTGKWRVNGDAKKQKILDIFTLCIKRQFCGKRIPIAIFEVTGKEEAIYGSCSLCGIQEKVKFEESDTKVLETFGLEPMDDFIVRLTDILRLNGIRYLVPVESGNGSTQISLVHVGTSDQEFKDAFRECNRLLTALKDEQKEC